MTYTSLKNTQKCWSITMIQSLPVDSFKLNCTILGVILKKDKDATGNGKSLVTVMKLGGLIPQRMKMLAVQTSGLRWPKGYNPQLTTFRPWRQAWRRYAPIARPWLTKTPPQLKKCSVSTHVFWTRRFGRFACFPVSGVFTDPLPQYVYCKFIVNISSNTTLFPSYREQYPSYFRF